MNEGFCKITKAVGCFLYGSNNAERPDSEERCNKLPQQTVARKDNKNTVNKSKVKEVRIDDENQPVIMKRILLQLYIQFGLRQRRRLSACEESGDALGRRRVPQWK